ncbi:MAG: TetR family transcriptional regulator [Clostridia bacterium]|nr:TetR family transcriptional regulator [Clostridia bacterium]
MISISYKDSQADSFRELAEINNTDRITLQEITDSCGLSTTAFYRQFKDRHDLIS